jgi:5-carboxymethyl-2-hydroxymuconate isomerase
MPHCTIEYSSSLERQIPPLKLVRELHNALKASNLFEEADIKVRSFGCDQYLVGGTLTNFAAILVRIIEGRTDEQKKKLAEGVIAHMKDFISADAVITVEVKDIIKAHYSKFVPEY